MELILVGFASILNLSSFLLIFAGVAIGIVFGAIPGLTATMALALFLPITYNMSALNGIVLLLGLYIGGISGGLISAILLKIPGTPSSVATTFDGHPMAMQGKAGRALGIGIVYSFIGGVISLLLLTFIAPAIAKVAIKFSAYEYFAIALFAITLIGSVSGDNLAKGLASGMLGIAFSLVGMAPIDGYPRFTFGRYELYAGFDILPVLIGLFAVSEIFLLAEDKFKKLDVKPMEYQMRGFGFSMKEFFGQSWNAIRSSIIGTGIGILPGIGGSIANMLAYMVAKKQSRNPEAFGTGIMDGIVAPESANNAVTGGALIPLLTLGIPGDATTAMLLGALMLHGLTPGPLLFRNNADLVYGIFAALLVANIFMLIIEYFGLRVFVKLLKIPKHILMPIIIVLCVVGAFGLNNRLFDTAAIIFFGLIGYGVQKIKLPQAPIVLGFILGPIIEVNFRRAVMFSEGKLLPFFTKPISGFFLLLAALSIIVPLIKSITQNKKHVLKK